MSKNTDLSQLVNGISVTAGQVKLRTYLAQTSWVGTAVANLAVDSAGNILTVSTVSGTVLNGTGFVRMSGSTPSYITGTASQFIKADGSLDSSVYLTTTTAGTTYVPLTRTITINGTALDLSANRSWTIATSDATKLPLAGGTMTGQILMTSATESFRMAVDNCYISGWNSANTTRYGYLQYTSTNLNLAAEAGAGLNLLVGGTSRIAVSTAGVTTLNGQLNLVDGLGDAGGGMRMISHTVTKVGGSKFIKISMGTNNWITGFIFAYNFDNYPPNSATSTGAGFTYQFAGSSDAAGASADKYFDLQWFGGNNVGNMGREMNTDGNGYIITTPTSTGAGGYRASATIFLFARDMSKITITYY